MSQQRAEGRGGIVRVGRRVQGRRREHGRARVVAPGRVRAGRRRGVPQQQRPAVHRYRGHRAEERGPLVDAPALIGDGLRRQPDGRRLLRRQPPVGVAEGRQRARRARRWEPAAEGRVLRQGRVQPVGALGGEDREHRWQEDRRGLPRQERGDALAPARGVGEPGRCDVAEHAVRAVVQGLFETVLELGHRVRAATAGRDQSEERRDIATGGAPVQPRDERADRGTYPIGVQQPFQAAEFDRSRVGGQSFQEPCGETCGRAVVARGSRGVGEQGHGQRTDRVPRHGGAVPGCQGVQTQPLQSRRGVAALTGPVPGDLGAPVLGASVSGRPVPVRPVSDGFERGGQERGREPVEGVEDVPADPVALVGQTAGGQSEERGDLPRITAEAGVGDQPVPGRAPLVGVPRREGGEQSGAGLGRRQQGEHVPDLLLRTARVPQPGDGGTRPCVPLGRRELREHPLVGPDIAARPARGDDGVHEGGPTLRGHAAQQRGEGAAVEPQGSERGQGRRVRRDQPTEDRRPGSALPARGVPVRPGEPPRDALGVHRDQVAQPLVDRTGQGVGAVRLQQTQDAFRRGGQSGGGPERVPRPPGGARPPGQPGEFPLRVVEDRSRMAPGQRAPVLGLQRAREFGQQPRRELR
ncbi:hypothetical protein [Streptomyces hydrogenans]|uniref:hypothetical protein n=1 Tax=Streptomyces hydrogenans TaxID=1873719 RepID=UPI0035D85BA5